MELFATTVLKHMFFSTYPYSKERREEGGAVDDLFMQKEGS